MDTNYSYLQEETEIDLIDLLRTLLSKWKSIMIIGIVCLLLGGLSGLLKEVPESGDIASEEEIEIPDVLEEEDIQREYDRIVAEYEIDLELYNYKIENLASYENIVKMLISETERLESIPETDSEARLAAIIRISGLQTAVSNTRSLFSNIGSTMPTEPDEYEEFRADMIEANEKEIEEALEELDAVLEESPGFSVKYAVVGFAAGVFMMCVFWSGAYLLDGTVKTQQDISRGFGVSILGSPDKYSFVAANIINFMPEGAKKLLITGSTDLEYIEKIYEAVGKLAGDKNIEIEAAGNLNSNADTAARLSQVDAVVLVEELKKSKLKDVGEEVMMIRSAGKKIIGAAV